MDIYVGNLPYDIEEQTVIDAFSEFGSVARFKLIMDRETGQPKGFGFLTMDDWKEAQAAIKALDGAEIAGRPARVNQAERKDGPGGGGGGGCGGYRGGGGGGRGGGGGGGRDRRGGGGGRDRY